LTCPTTDKEEEVADEAKDLSQIKQEDVEAVTEKLKEWMPTLPEQEQLVMGWVLTRAAAAGDEDVKEYTESAEGGVPVSTLMAEAAGLQDTSGYALPIHTIGPVKIWTFRW
jgi:hypothetical protein